MATKVDHGSTRAGSTRTRAGGKGIPEERRCAADRGEETPYSTWRSSRRGQGLSRAKVILQARHRGKDFRARKSAREEKGLRPVRRESQGARSDDVARRKSGRVPEGKAPPSLREGTAHDSAARQGFPAALRDLDPSPACAVGEDCGEGERSGGLKEKELRTGKGDHHRRRGLSRAKVTRSPARRGKDFRAR